jgi:8-oxo-dGTP diphosphatase
MPDFRDGSGKALDDYPRPSVAVDTAVLTLDDRGRLSVLLAKTKADPRLPGTFLHQGETLADAVLRSLSQKVGVEGLSPTQLHVFDDPNRDDRGWVLSVAHLDAVPPGRLELDDHLAELCAVDKLPAVPYGHDAIVTRAVSAIRAEYADRPDPRRLLSAELTLRNLHTLHEAVAGRALARDTFRRLMEPQLIATGEFSAGVVGKPARIFSRKEK